MPHEREIYGNLAHLPPLDVWLQNPNSLAKFYVPTDDRGFVVHDAAIESVLALFDEAYEWPVDWQKGAPQILRPDDHHFQWIASRYDPHCFPGSSKSDIPRKFRNLPSNRGLLPRQFHNVIHTVTRPPKLPKLRQMELYLRSFELSLQLFRHAERVMRIEQLMDCPVSEYKLDNYRKQHQELSEHYTGYIEQALGINAFEMIGIEEDFNPYSLPELHQKLGSCALLNIPNYTTEYFHRATVTHVDCPAVA